jgi:hypothetical protein
MRKKYIYIIFALVISFLKFILFFKCKEFFLKKILWNFEKQLNNQISKNKIYGNTTYEQHWNITKPEATSNNIH